MLDGDSASVDSRSTPACKKGPIFVELFEDSSLAPNWSVSRIRGQGRVVLTSSVAQSGRQGVIFDPTGGCCKSGCKGANVLSLQSRSIDLMGCTSATISLFFRADDMEVLQDTLTLQVRSSRTDSWRPVAQLFSKVSSKHYTWIPFSATYPLPSNAVSNLVLRFLHVSQCDNDKAYLDSLRIEGT